VVPEPNASTGIVQKTSTDEGDLQPESEMPKGMVEEMPVPLSHTGWRMEVIQEGKFYQFRSGTGKNRRSAYGGKFSDLSAERQAAYKRKARRKAGRKGRA
jgi:hypothetical protein